MSFSSDVKEELAREISTRRHCQIAELSSICSACGKVKSGNLRIRTENVQLARKAFTLLKKTFRITSCIDIRQGSGFSKNHTYEVWVKDTEDTSRVLAALKKETLEPGAEASALLIQNDCCKKAFLRGAFLSSGSMNDPGKSYHFEIVCTSQKQAQQLEELMATYGIEAKTVERKKKFVVYVKEGTQIVDLLNLMGAHQSMMEMENIRIWKDMRNQVNRQVNCETANLNKTTRAAGKQIEEIRYLEAHGMLEQLPENLQEIARARVEHPDLSLKELGEILDPPIGKSGVNHRLKKISEIAGIADTKEDR